MQEQPTTTAAPRGARLVLVLLVVAFALYHLLAVTSAALPPNRYSEATRPMTGHLGAYFAQNWRLFAPNPVSSDRVVRFQGAYEEDGELVVTDWVDWTDVELDLVRHRVVGGRAGYVTNKLYGPLGQRYRALDPVQRQVADVQDPADAPTWDALEEDLLDAEPGPLGGTPAGPVVVALYLAYDEATTRLATDVLAARHPDREMVAVRYATRSWDVTPWAARGGSAEEREAARPRPEQRVGGWREPLAGDAAEREAVADFDRRHR